MVLWPDVVGALALALGVEAFAMNPETPRRRGRASGVAAVGLWCSLVASCGDWHIGGIDRVVGGSGGSGGGGGGTPAGECGEDGVCRKHGEGGGGPFLVWIG